MAAVPRREVWEYPKWISEHAFDRLRLIDCTFSEFDLALESAEVIEETTVDPDVLKELLLLVEWKRPLHVVVVVDSRGREERIVTVYEPHGDRWSGHYRERR
ncbi:MAG TPA: DUF4258 domain-containing protein [Acidimicrobiia bacterium]|nr:DUF4258 domain-containing protein [Acidimicrobiia bacterium]